MVCKMKSDGMEPVLWTDFIIINSYKINILVRLEFLFYKSQQHFEMETQ